MLITTLTFYNLIEKIAQKAVRIREMREEKFVRNLRLDKRGSSVLNFKEVNITSKK